VALALSNHVLGVILKYKYIEPTIGNRHKYAIARKIHAIVGYVIYVDAKL